MKPGDLVTAKAFGLEKMGFITRVQDRHDDGFMWYFVQFTNRGDGYWYPPHKIRVISES